MTSTIPSYLLFQKRILGFIRPFCSNTFDVSNVTGLVPLTRLRVSLSHMNIVSLIFQIWIVVVKTTLKWRTTHVCTVQSFQRLTFLQKIQGIEPNILMKSCGNITRLLSVGLNSLCNWNTTLTSASINSETSWPRRSFMYPWVDYIVLQYLSVNIY